MTTRQLSRTKHASKSKKLGAALLEAVPGIVIGQKMWGMILFGPWVSGLGGDDFGSVG